MAKEAAVAAAETTTVTITETGTPVCWGKIRPVDGQFGARKKGRTWTYDLLPGDYIFEIEAAGVAPAKYSFAVDGATATTATAFTLKGTPGTVVARTEDIAITV